MEIFDQVNYWTTFVSRLFTIGATGIAIWVFIFNREKISSAFDLLLNYSKRMTLNELNNKIQRLNDFTANDATQKMEVINILSEIEGQIIGNKKIAGDLKAQLSKIHRYIDSPKTLSEPKKRSLVSELRESIRNIDLDNLEQIAKK